MNSRLLLLACALLLPVGGRAASEATWNPPVVDLRVGLSQAMSRDPSLAQGSGQAGYVQLERGGVVGVLLPLPAHEPDALRRKNALSDYFTLRGALESSQRFAIDDCRRRTGRISVWFELEAANELAQAPSAVGLWVERGVRVFRIGSERDNPLATSGANASLVGLTLVGRDVVNRILAAGALVDVSDASEQTLFQVLELAEKAGAPVIATHSNARALADRPRNLSDDAIRGIARSGGVIGVTVLRDSLAAGRSATLDHWVHQIVYLVRVAGPEHVALGTGFESGAGPVRDFLGARDFPRLAMSLRAAGLSAPDVERVFSGNAERILCATRVKQ
ncbi:MAG TPA: membrane dipeptidase [Polyangiaceae bacterium]|jgi:membrane dipeptidase|nr:membrane dipeptidase [Polyangiaceae bacterium]